MPCCGGLRWSHCRPHHVGGHPRLRCITDIVIDEDGIPRFADRRIAVTLIVAKIGGSSHSVESFSREYDVDPASVRAALRWAAQHPEHIDTVYRRRVDALREEGLEFPGDVEPPVEDEVGSTCGA